MSSEVVDDRSLQVDAAIAEYLESVECGSPLELETFLSDHSTIADELREFLDDYRVLQEVVPQALSDPATTMLGRLPRQFGEFELLEEIARGGMGVVYKARQQSLDRIVALKMILAGELASQAEVERFHAEAHAAATLDHPNIVPIFEVGQHEGQHFFAMGYIDGESLAERLVRGPIPPREAASLIGQVALAVDYAHQRGIIHRDLKPANILIDSAGRVRVMDFGLAKCQGNTGLTGVGQMLGTPNYMPPEQMSNSTETLGPPADVYAMGATLYALVTGRPPFQAANTLDTMQQVLGKEPVPPREFNPSIPRDLETILLKCLEKSARNRYPSANELAADLERFQDNRPILARRTTQAERFVRWCNRNRIVATLAATLATFLVVAIVILSKSNADFRREAAARDGALATALRAVDQMLTRVANDKLRSVPLAHPLRESLLEDSLEFYEGFLAQAVGDASLHWQMHEVLNSMGCIQRELGEFSSARNSFQRSITILESLAPTDPHPPAIREKIAETQKALAFTLKMDPNPSSQQEAVIQLHLTLEMYQGLEREWPDRLQPIGFCQMHLAELAHKSGTPEDAERYWRQAIASGEAYLRQQPTDSDARSALCWSCADLCDAILLRSQERVSEAEPILIQGLQHSSVMLETNPRSSQAREATAFLNQCLARCYCQLGQYSKALSCFQLSIREMERLCSEFPWSRQYWDLAGYFQQEFVNGLRSKRRQTDARRSMQEIVGWLEVESPRLPQDTVVQANLARFRSKIASILRTMGEEEQADALGLALIRSPVIPLIKSDNHRER